MMPGIFGAVGLERERNRELLARHRKCWPDCEGETREGIVVGGSSPAEDRPLVEGDDGWLLIDGEHAAYRAVEESGYGQPGADISSTRSELLQVSATIAIVRPSGRTVQLEADWSGGFPVYWIGQDGSFAFSTLLAPLAAVMEADVDPLGVASFLKDGYFVGNRSCYRNVRRVGPGEIVSFDEGTGTSSVEETSQLWSGSAVVQNGDEDLWTCLRSCVDESLVGIKKTGLMMSAGWDSRTLLAAVTEDRSPERLRSLSHGDPESRELRIVASLCDTSEVPYTLRPIGPAELAPAYLRETHRRCGTAQFPHWRESAQALSEMGSDCAMAGVFGEVLGGHYGPSMAMSGWRKMRWVGSQLLGIPLNSMRSSPDFDAGAIRDLLVRGIDSVHHFFEPDFLRGRLNDVQDAFSAEVAGELERLRSRGIRDPARLIEAYMTEHRGAQYINAQLRSARIETPVAMPFAHRELLGRASVFPLESKIHNKQNRAMLERARPALLENPLAAVLVPAKAPLILQEASRAVRKVWEQGSWWLHDVTSERFPRPRLGWIDFEFLAGTRILDRLVDDFRWQGWNREAARSLAESVRTRSWQGSLHKPAFQLLKMYTLDLDLRTAASAT